MEKETIILRSLSALLKSNRHHSQELNKCCEEFHEVFADELRPVENEASEHVDPKLVHDGEGEGDGSQD